MPAVLFHSEYHDPAVWRPALLRHIPDLDFRLLSDVGDPSEIDAILTVAPPANWQATFPNLRLLQTLGAGVDHLVGQAFPENVLLARVSEAKQISGLCDYVLGGAIHFHRDMHVYARDQREMVWRPRSPVLASLRTVGVMGLGTFGETCARKLAEFGFRTRGWSRSAKIVDRVETFSGDEGLNAFLTGCDILVCMLPLTDSTRGILRAQLFAQLPDGACLINVGRGGHCVEADLVAALESGKLGGALLDVMEVEPLPADSPLWTAPNLILTPHIGTRADTEAAAAIVADNILRLRAGRPVAGLVERLRGY